MTAGTLEKVYRLRDGRVTPAAGAVLAYLAYRAYYANGRAAWPALDTIAAACFIGRKTVIRAIDLLIDLGYLEVAEDQQWNALDSETGMPKRKNYRTKVYNVLPENFVFVEDEGKEQADDRAAAEVRAHVKSEGCQNVTPEETLESSRNVGVSECHPYERDEHARGDILSSQGCQNVTQLTNKPTNNPSAPTGHLPASGANPGKNREDETNDRDAWTPAVDTDPGAVAGGTIDGGERDEAVDRALSALVEQRSKLGLDAHEATNADRNAVRRLFERLAKRGQAQPLALVLGVVAYLPERDYWLRQVMTGRDLARHFDRIRNDMLVDQTGVGRNHSTGDGKTAVTEPRAEAPAEPWIPKPPAPKPDSPHGPQCRHSWHCEHVLALMAGREDRFDHQRDGYAPSAWMRVCERVASLLNEGVDPQHAADQAERETKSAERGLEVTA